MGFEIIESGSIPVLRFDGVLGLGDTTEGFSALTPTGFGVSNFVLLVDLREVERIEVDLDESHELVRMFRMINQIGPDLAVAVVAEGQVRRDAEQHFLVRDTLTGRDPAQLARLMSFDDVDDARAWLAESG